MWHEAETEGSTVLFNYDHVVFVKEQEDGTCALVFKDGSVIEVSNGFEGLKRVLLNIGV